MRYIIFTFVFIYSCTDRSLIKDYSIILQELSKNYVLLYSEIEKDLFYESFKLDQKSLKVIDEEYNIAIKSFYDSDKFIIPFLLQFEEDTTNFCTWISTINPYKSNIDVNN
ncbi:MAG: hypothetical protein AAF806_00540, partial [Bacteroidota bacterium]